MFKPEHKNIYRYHDGEKEVAVDPLSIYRKLLAAETYLNDAQQMALWLPSLQAGNQLPINEMKACNEALERLTTTARQIFQVKPLALLEDGTVTGYSDQDAYLLLEDFSKFILDLQRKN